MCNRFLLLFGKMPQWNFYVNFRVNETTFQSVLRFQTGFSSHWFSCKRALKLRFLKIRVWSRDWSPYYDTLPNAIISSYEFSKKLICKIFLIQFEDSVRVKLFRQCFMINNEDIYKHSACNINDLLLLSIITQIF